MLLIPDPGSHVLVQGITGTQGRLHTAHMLRTGTRIVAGTSPGKGGEVIESIAVYDSVAAACTDHRIDASVVFVPPGFCKSALLDAIEAGIPCIVCVTEGVPVHDMIAVLNHANAKGVRIIGPNTPGLILPGHCKIGIMPEEPFVPGNVAIVSRSGTLMYEVADQLSRRGIGQSVAIGIGGDVLTGFGFDDILPYLEEDAETRAIVLLGEIGGDEEERAAELIRDCITKPVIAFIAGKSAPPGIRYGHAGAIITGHSGTYASKREALERAGVPVADQVWDIPHIVGKVLENREYT